MSESRSFPFTEPSLVRLLVLASFLYLLNVIRILGDYLLYAGLIAELGLGIVYGSPLANVLSYEWETTFNILGYLGLVLIVFEGGLSTNLPLLVSNLFLSCLCALTGIGLPIALSFALLPTAYGYTPLEAFAAGAALSSTSLGTTLAALNSVSKKGSHLAPHDALRKSTASQVEDTVEVVELDCGEQCSVADLSSSPAPFPKPLHRTRIGTVLISAAIIDDVVGLVIAALMPALTILSTSGSPTQSSHLAWAVIRPLLSSLLIATITPLVARFILRPAFWFCGIGERWCAPRREGQIWGWVPAFVRTEKNDGLGLSGWGTEAHADAVKLAIMVGVLSAFAATAYYTGSSMLFGAYIAGLTLSYIARPPEGTKGHAERAEALSFEAVFSRMISPLQEHMFAPLFFASIGYAIPFLSLWDPTVLWRGVIFAVVMFLCKFAVGLPIMLWTICTGRDQSGKQSPPPAPHSRAPECRTSLRTAVLASLYPAAFFGFAMVSRGEIGLLIAQIARQGDGDGRALLGEEAFLVCIWAILLCTLVGPISVGLMVRKWRARVVAGIWS